LAVIELNKERPAPVALPALEDEKMSLQTASLDLLPRHILADEPGCALPICCFDNQCLVGTFLKDSPGRALSSTTQPMAHPTAE
jgi:hypothetical protein